MIQVYVVTGLLESGKTTLINNCIRLLRGREKVLVVQMEEGEEKISQKKNVEVLQYGKQELERKPQAIVDRVCKFLEDHMVDKILVEWNGMEHFAKLEEMFMQFSVYGILRLEKVVYVASERDFKIQMGSTGQAPLSQVAGSDYALLRGNGGPGVARAVSQAIKAVNPGIKVFPKGKEKSLEKKFFDPGRKQLPGLLLVCGALAFYTVTAPFFEELGLPLNTLITVFLGVFLQAAPFLVIGVLLSSAIQMYVSEEWMARRFPKQVWKGMGAALVMGFCLPVCDCAAVPVFKSLLQKKVPLPAAITFMLVSPIVNPVSLLSTYYAFNGNWPMLGARAGLGIIAAMVVGLTFLIKPPSKYVLKDSLAARVGNCGFYDMPAKEGKRRFSLFIRHAQREFFAVGKYLVIGIFISTAFQDLVSGKLKGAAGLGAGLALAAMMGMAFLLSLCSSSDAVVARSFASTFPVGSLLGFLVFGPMMDVKNMAMLTGSFSKRFVLRLLATTFCTCYLVVMVFQLWGNGGIRL